MESRTFQMIEEKELEFLQKSKSYFRDHYFSKVMHDFSCYVFLMLKLEMKRPIDEVVRLASSYPGYQCHKGIRYKGDLTSHFYVKFKDSMCAKQAAEEIKRDPAFTVNILSSVLQDWYFVEMMSQDQQPSWTHAVIEFVGMEFNSPAIKDDIRTLLDQFGETRTISYVNNPNIHMHTMQVLFVSLAEALGATIALGLWYQGSQPISNAFYKMKILLSDKEQDLIQRVGAPNNCDFVDLEYFVPSNISESFNEMNGPFEQQYSLAQYSPIDFQNSAFQTLPIQKHWNNREFRNNNRFNRPRGRGGRNQRNRLPIQQGQQIPNNEFPDIKPTS